MPFKDNGRAQIVGERTWRSTGQPIFQNFDEDIQIGIGSIRAYFPNGEPFEDIYSNRDAILDKALELI